MIPPTPGKKPKKAKFAAGSYFSQKKGPRTGQDYIVKRGKSGKNVRVYETGDTALAS